ncbi:hypothetical protein AB0O31_34390 [Kitasatospora cineracea]|uniref:hypothetical protein n=1 Tax=Kitasatospora cineracea TaxID=88074 RepID=UPI00342A0384
MTETECGACSYRGSDLDDLRLHWEEAGHGPLCEKKPRQFRSFGRGAKVVALTGLGLAAAGAGVFAVKKAGENAELVKENARLAGENAELNAWAGSLVAQLAGALARVGYLESSTGAGKTLNGYRGR